MNYRESSTGSSGTFGPKNGFSEEVPCFMPIKYSVLELASVAEGVTIHHTFKNVLHFARKVEEMGYHRFWLAEHHNTISIASSTPPVLIGYIAGGTERIRVGSGGVMLPNHSPLIVSEQFGTLGQLYPGRIDLGLGRAPGTDQVTAQAIRPDRMKSILNFPAEIEQIQQYFSDNRGAAVRATVAEGVDVPIYVLGSSTDSAHVAARLGLPYAFASHFATAYLFEALDIYHNEFQPSAHLKEPYTIAGVNIIAAETTEEAERLFTSLIRMFLGVLTNQREYLKPPSELTPDLRELLYHPQVQQMLKYTFVGDAVKVKAETQEFLEQTRVNELMTVANVYDVDARIRSAEIFAEVMKEINAEAVPSSSSDAAQRS